MVSTPTIAVPAAGDDEQLLRSLFDNTLIGIVLLSIDGDITYANSAYAGLLGRSVDELLELHLEDFIIADDARIIRQNLKKIESGTLGNYTFERRYIHKDGRIVYVQGATSVLRGKGKPPIIVAQAVDITPQKQAEKDLLSSEERWARLHERLDIAISAGRIGVWDYDLVDQRAHWDDRLHEIYGTDKHLVRSLDSWSSILHPDDRQRVLATWERAQRSDTHYDDEFRIIRPDGDVRHIRSIAHIFRDVHGKAIRAVGANWDVTDQKKLMEKAFEEKERLGITLASIADAVICTDGESRITFMNPVAEKLTGWSSDEVAGQMLANVFNIIDEATGDRAPDPVAQCLKDNIACQRDSGVFLVNRSGGVSDIQMSAAPVKTAAGGSIGSVLVFRDVTEAHAHQKKIAHSALHDALTGLPNRSAFIARINDAIAQVRQERRIHALCFIDLDHFKQVNDRSGHAAGDALLKETAKIIALNCSKKDVPARLGGDEFALLIRDCKEGEAEATAERIIGAISRMEFRWEREVFRIGASVGATMMTEDSPELSEILHQADKACYAAKAAGRNRVCFYGQLNQPQIDEFVDRDARPSSWLQ